MVGVAGPAPTYIPAEMYTHTRSEVSLFILTTHVEYGRVFYKMGIILETAASLTHFAIECNKSAHAHNLS